MSRIYIPETLEDCKTHYLPPNPDYIHCLNFGNIDGMNGTCHWCREMTPYMWWMCSDASWLSRLLLSPAKTCFASKEDAIAHIDFWKQNMARTAKKENCDKDGTF